MFFRTPLIVFALALTAGCRGNGGAVAQTPEMRPTREPVLARESTRDVIAKRAPDTLLARDGSSCRVAPDVYASASVGSLFRCRWVQG